MLKSKHLFDLKIKAGIIASILLFLVLPVQLYKQHNQLVLSQRWVTHTLEVQENASALKASLMESSSAIRGYFLINDPQLRKFSEEKLDLLMPLHSKLVDVIQDNDTQQALLQKLQGLLEKRVAQGRSLLQVDRQSSEIPTMIVASEHLLDELRIILSTFQDNENNLLRTRQERLRNEEVVFLVWNSGIIAVFFIIISLLAHWLYKELNARRYLIEQQSQMNLQLELRNDELQKANKAIVDSNRLKNEFLAAMSHELRTPLNSIIGFTGLMRLGIAGEINDEQRKQLNMVNDSAQHLLHLISDLLDLSRIETGKAELFIEKFDLHDVVKDVFAIVSPLSLKKGLELKHDAENVPMMIQSDRRKVYQVLLNLLSNAIKFSEKGDITVTSLVEADQYRIAVRDQGIGITPEQISLLFQAFRQVDGSSKKVYEGTGLGLYLSKCLLELLGGTVTAQSVFGEGSTFCFTLPKKLPEVQS